MPFETGELVMLGQTLLAEGALTEEQLQAALAEQRMTGGLLGDVLLRLGLVSEDVLSAALAKEAGVPFATVNGARPDPSAVALVPESFARQHLVAPLGFRNHALEVLQVNPFDVVSIDTLQQLTGRMLHVVCGTRTDVLRLIKMSYGERNVVSDLADEAMAALDSPTVTSVADSPMVRLIDRVISEAVAKGATDLHFEPEETVVSLRYRIDGVLFPGDTLPKALHPPLVSRMKVMSGLDIAEQRLPQEGRTTHETKGRRVDLRVSSFPTVFGEKIAIRILEKDKLVRGLEELGFSKRNLALYKDALNRSRGIVLVTGPTGAGKTTTLYSSLSHLGGRSKNILTVEDPVEYEIPSIRQTQVKPKAGLTFAVAIRSLLRQDPDVIMVGEIRDPESAQLGLRAALSGVLVFSTLHTQDSAGAVPRLMDMGLEPYLLASGVVAVVAQRLVRIVCRSCKEPATYPAETLAKLGLDADPGILFYRGKGCDRCEGTGYKGRTGVFEILNVDSTIHSLIRDRADSRLVRDAAKKAGMKTLLEDGIAKAAFGQTTLEEVLRVAYE